MKNKIGSEKLVDIFIGLFVGSCGVRWALLIRFTFTVLLIVKMK